MHRGFLKLWRKILDWEWYGDPNMMALFFHLLLKANIEDKKWKGKTIKRGQLITGRKKLSKQTGISEQTIRSCLTRLKSTNELTIKSTNRYSLITLNNYEAYNDKSTSTQTSDLTNNQPATNQQLTTTKEDKKVRKDISIGTNRSPKRRKGRNPLIEKCLKEFTQTTGFQPTDPKPRFVAHNLVQKIQSLQKRRGKTINQKSTLRAIHIYFEWIRDQDWSEGLHHLKTVKLKLPIFEAELDQHKEIYGQKKAK